MNSGIEFTNRYLKLMFKSLRDATPEQVQQELEHCRHDNQRPVRAPRIFRSYFEEERFLSETGYEMQVFKRDNHSRKLIFYLHGGATIYQPVYFHWRFLHDLSLRTHADIVMPIYPKAPEYHTSFALPTVMDYYHQIIEPMNYEEIHFMGDSAGACSAMVMAQEIDKRGWQPHTSLTLISPCLDLTYGHEKEMLELQDKDTMIQLERIRIITDVWRGELPSDHPWVSPLYGNLQCLNNISVYYGSNEILKVDVDLLREALAKIGKMAYFSESEGMFHTFVMFPVPQGFTAVKEIANKIKNPKTIK